MSSLVGNADAVQRRNYDDQQRIGGNQQLGHEWRSRQLVPDASGGAKRMFAMYLLALGTTAATLSQDDAAGYWWSEWILHYTLNNSWPAVGLAAYRDLSFGSRDTLAAWCARHGQCRPAARSGRCLERSTLVQLGAALQPALLHLHRSAARFS